MRAKLLPFVFLTVILGCQGFSEDQCIVEAIRQFPEGLDPAKNFGVDEVQIYSQIYESLFVVDSSNNIIPHLAEKIIASPNNDSFLIKLKPNIYFHDGSHLTADDIKASYEWQVEKKPKSSVFEMVDHLDISDSMHVKIVLKYSYSTFPYLLASPSGLVIMSKMAIEKFGSMIRFNPIGTGPFKLIKWDSSGNLELSLYKKYWGDHNNKIEKIKFINYPDKYKREESISTGDSDILYLISGYSVDRLRWLGKINYEVLPANSVIFLGFNNSDPKLSDERVRTAIISSLNVPKLVLNVNRGNAEVADNPMPPIYHSNFLKSQDKFNIIRARELMKMAGYENGLILNLDFPTVAFMRSTILEIIKSDLAKINISLRIIEFNSWEEHTKAVKSDSAQLFIYGGKSGIIGDPEDFLRSFFHSKSEFNTLHYQNARVDAWLDQARLESDPERRQELYKKITEQILEDTPAVFLYHVKPHFAYNREKIKTLPVNPYGIIQYHKIELNN